MSPGVQAFAIGLGLTLIAQILAILAGIVLSGFKVGKLERLAELTLPIGELEAFRARLLLRLSQLGFRPCDRPQEFLQSGGVFGDPTSCTHAKTKKKFRFSITPDGGQARIGVGMKYLDPIVGDTGETAYADSVLRFVTGQTDEMVVVPNRSHMAVTTMLGGGMTVAAALGLTRCGVNADTAAVAVLIAAGTNLATGVIAIITIQTNRRKELTGTCEAVVGMVLAVVAMAIVGIGESMRR